ncbi:hypothetical protein SK803_03950 [Lentzea sp. BCCO 10_0856]|uniref:Tachylectin n=1 Tax=Lentzea miocenica TaxID=3095431 RepID=A0ABU4STZ3_9PSEU|nr:hypothetical protein [Lentzea sp. BCCO 10_0856]MDX8029346.1 hypothetical protein [Lentzea sp. BCCO 10_0856]
MQRRRVFGVLFTGLVLASTVTAPHAVAADPCRWIAHDLPLPAGAAYARTWGSSENNRFIVGATRIDGAAERGLIWDNGALRLMTSSGSPTIGVEPADVNNVGVVVGEWYSWNDGIHRAFRYRDGVYEYLDTPAGQNSKAVAINALGDVIGETWSPDTPTYHRTVVWPGSGPRKDFPPGEGAVGITDDRKIVQIMPRWAAVTEIESGRSTELTGARWSMVLDNDRVLHPAEGGLKEWNIAGEHVATWEGGTEPFGRTSSGHVVFGAVAGIPTLWQWGVRYPVDSAKLPDAAYYGDISDEGALIGTYKNSDGSTHPARWFWCG